MDIFIVKLQTGQTVWLSWIRHRRNESFGTAMTTQLQVGIKEEQGHLTRLQGHTIGKASLRTSRSG